MFHNNYTGMQNERILMVFLSNNDHHVFCNTPDVCSQLCGGILWFLHLSLSQMRRLYQRTQLVRLPIIFIWVFLHKPIVHAVFVVVFLVFFFKRAGQRLKHKLLSPVLLGLYRNRVFSDKILSYGILPIFLRFPPLPFCTTVTINSNLSSDMDVITLQNLWNSFFIQKEICIVFIVKA